MPIEHHPARGNQRLRTIARPSLHLIAEPRHRGIAGGVRASNGGNHRHHDQGSGIEAPGGAVSIYGRSHGEVEPSFSYGGGAGSFSYLVSGDFLRNDLGIESPDGSSNPIHDHTTQSHGFGYVEDILNDNNRVALMLGSSVGKFQIRVCTASSPRWATPSTGKPLRPRRSTRTSAVTQFGALSWQHSQGALDMQTSVIARYSSLALHRTFPATSCLQALRRTPTKRTLGPAGARSDGAYKLNGAHTIRAGLFLQSSHSIWQHRVAGTSHRQCGSAFERCSDDHRR